MIPSSGWLDPANNVNREPESVPLPVPHVYSYGDGAAGTFDIDLDLVEFPFAIIVLVSGGFIVIPDAGYIGTTFGFLVSVSQVDAYGVLLVDSIDPPEPTPFTLIHCPPPTSLVVESAATVAFTLVDRC